MNHRYTLQEFVNHTQQKDQGQGLFELENERTLEINVANQVWAKMGTMVSYKGDLRFTREGVFEHGFSTMFKKAFTSEGTSLMKVKGRGTLYLADKGKKITILELRNDAIFVNGNDLLAFEPSISWDIKFIKKIGGMLSSGLFNVKLSGEGLVAITSYYNPLTLGVTPDQPIYTDPHATVAWSANLVPDFKTDVSFRTFLGRGSGESLQMKFTGDGFVVVQPFEEHYHRN